MKENIALILKHWRNKKEKKTFNRVLCNCSADEVKFLCESALIIINGRIPFNINRVLTYEKELKL